MGSCCFYQLNYQWKLKFIESDLSLEFALSVWMINLCLIMEKLILVYV